MNIDLHLNLFLIFLLLGGLLILIGALAAGVLKKRIVGRVIVTLGLLALVVSGVSLVSLLRYFGSMFDACADQTECLESELQTIDRSCSSSNDCQLIQYYPCKENCVSKEAGIDYGHYWSEKCEREDCLLMVSCGPPKSSCACDNGTCVIREQ